jgi:phosphonate transport system substrate-binding protein
MKKSLLIIFVVLVLTLIMTALLSCERQDQARSDIRQAGNGASPKALLIGLIPEQNIFEQMERYEPIAAYLSEKTGVEIQLKILLRYGNIVKNFKSEGLDGAFFGSFTYALAHEKLGVRVIARPESVNGSSSYRGFIFARKDSGIRSVGDMRGKRFAFVDKATTAGYVFPLSYFRRERIDYRSYLREFYFAGTHENVIDDVLDRKADVGAAKDTVFARLAAENPRIKQELQILERSSYVPENGLAVRPDLQPEIVQKLQSELLAMNKNTKGSEVLRTFGAKRFIVTTEEDYRPVYEYARKAGIDLATYDYLND